MIIMIGMAGAGKSTQGEMLAEKYGWTWLSAGQVLRDSGKFQAEQSKGILVDKEVIAELVLKKVYELEAQGKRVILDGFPRGKEQTKWMLGQKELLGDVEAVLCLKADTEELKRRLLARGRADDTLETIEGRLGYDAGAVEEVAQTLRGGGLEVTEIDGGGTREEVQRRIERALETRGLLNREEK